MKNMTITDIVRHPVTLVVGGFSAATTLLNVKALTIVGAYFWGHIGELFTVLSLAGFSVAPNIAQVPDDPFVVAAVVAGIVFGLKKLFEMGTELDDKLDK